MSRTQWFVHKEDRSNWSPAETKTSKNLEKQNLRILAHAPLKKSSPIMKLKSRLLKNNWLKETNGPVAWNYWFRNFKLKINFSKKSLLMKWRLITSPTWKKESNMFQNWFIPSFKPQDRWSMNRPNHKKGKDFKLRKTISKNHKSRSKSSNPAKRMELKQQGHFNQPNHIKNYRKIKYRVVYKLKVRPKDQQSMVTCLYFKAVSSSKMRSKYWPAKIIRWR